MGLDIITMEMDQIAENILNDVDGCVSQEVLDRLSQLITEHDGDDWYEKAHAILMDPASIQPNQEMIDLCDGDEDEAREDCIDHVQVSAVNMLQRYKSFLEALAEPIPDAYMNIARQYEMIYEEPGEDVQDSRMGSYSMIHFGRQYAYMVADLFRQKGLVVGQDTYTLTAEDVNDILIGMMNAGHTAYVNGTENYFPAFCNHSDCDGCYIPSLHAVDESYTGSSVQLLLELHTLNAVGAIQPLRDLIEAKDAEYGNVNQVAPQNDVMVYNAASNVLWVWRKMMYHAADSVIYGTVVEFG